MFSAIITGVGNRNFPPVICVGLDKGTTPDRGQAYNSPGMDRAPTCLGKYLRNAKKAETSHDPTPVSISFPSDSHKSQTKKATGKTRAASPPP
jgi:hypothetical protein